MITSSELREREIINLVDGRRLGNLYDLELNPDTGEVMALILPEIEGRFLWRRVNEFQIPWSQVVLIGVDCILVECPELADPAYQMPKRREEAREPGNKLRGGATPSFSGTAHIRP
ncbi:MAG: YlmC/YmxH family sporulation protein [Limnochordales bacterium]|nr:YlmC/YmxH family sporulation protein [Limnochordales bacterium]